LKRSAAPKQNPRILPDGKTRGCRFSSLTGLAVPVPRGWGDDSSMGRSSGFRVVLLCRAFPSHWDSGVIGFRHRLQRRVRDGFAPSSLSSEAGETPRSRNSAHALSTIGRGRGVVNGKQDPCQTGRGSCNMGSLAGSIGAWDGRTRTSTDEHGRNGEGGWYLSRPSNRTPSARGSAESQSQPKGLESRS